MQVAGAILFFDTETTGLPTRRNAPASDVAAWPRMVQLAWALYDESGAKIDTRSDLIQPVGFTIPRDAQQVHGISTEMAERLGVPAAVVLASFAEAARGASLLVAHNFNYDAGVLGAEFHRLGVADPLQSRPRLCTMEAATAYCAIPGRYGFKWPNLGQLHTKLFGATQEKAHDAAADVDTCAKCFFELKRLGVV